MTATVDPITLDIIENALMNTRLEMDSVLMRISLSPLIREQHDAFPMICNERGQMVVGQFGSYVPGVLEQYENRIEEGDVFVWNDPYACRGSISHNNDWCVMLPIFHDGTVVGYASMFGHMVDVGGKVAGSMPYDARSIWEEGLRVPPVKVYEKGVLNEGVLDIMLNNSRTPHTNRSDLMALIAGCRTGAKRVGEICDRFGQETYLSACDQLLDRTKEAMRALIRKFIPEEPVSFTDYVDDDGRGNGPFKMTLSIHRRGDIAVFDWTGTDDQAEGPINFHIHEGLCKLFFGIYMIMAFDPEMLFNEGFYDLFEVVLPEGSLLNPRFPAPLGNRLNTHTRFFDCQAGALGQQAPHLSMAAGYGTSPHFIFSGHDSENQYFQMMELLFGGVPGRPRGDGLDGHAWWPLFSATPIEYIENYNPVMVESYRPIRDSGGAGLHRGGGGIEKVYRLLQSGEISIHDDRETVPPWGINGGLPGGTSSKWIIRNGSDKMEQIPSKIDNLPVEPGDRIIFRTAGSGGWGDPLEREPDLVARDVQHDLLSTAKAEAEYGVVLSSDGAVDAKKTAALRASMRDERGEPARFNMGFEPDEARQLEPALS
ncbi:hydantoinase B/oxoprolinase family protein [Parasphingopyxis algicola]|uniref:hydantoinase B/oxoprolinase family protein n=1 Tax=Parasphingopyxis algicola TaxID=2026624 RepID=UPI0015A06914|nr:hydantoinase B/oxoprolinase family protein [Parasphingopyxis algicola]QLC26388.1 hydantoinase B/oxoprolinase family protein [Parasphingopyxis algicola]